MTEGASEARRDLAAAALLLAPLALLPFGVAAELPLLLAALLGLVALLRGRMQTQAQGWRLATVLFLAYWLPELISAVDSIAPRKSWIEVAADLRFLPFLWFAVHALCNERRVRYATLGAAGLLAFWCADALVQAATGWSLGGAGQGDRLSGIFGDDNLKLGGVIAALAPFGLLSAWRRFGARGAALAFLIVLAVVLLAGARAAWIGLAIAVSLVLWRQLGTRRGAIALGLTLVLAVVAGLVAHALSPRFAERIARTTAVFEGGSVELDHALAGRLPIWRVALAMSAAHPINGVGVRAFRYAYPELAAADDPWVNAARTEGAAHAHQVLLELTSETGVLGLLCWGFGVFLAWRAWRDAPESARARAAAPAYALVVMLFPINTHYAVYSSFWSVLLFGVVGMWVGALHAREGVAR